MIDARLGRGELPMVIIRGLDPGSRQPNDLMTRFAIPREWLKNFTWLQNKSYGIEADTWEHAKKIVEGINGPSNN